MKLISYENANINKLFQMYNDLPDIEWDFINQAKNTNFLEFEKMYNCWVEDEFNQNMPTKRFILENRGVYIGYIALKLSKDVSWLSKGSQLFYQIRLSERGKGYSNEMIQLALNEMKKYGFKSVRVNCNNENIPSKKAIIKNGGVIDIKDYKSNTGISSSYLIDI